VPGVFSPAREASVPTARRFLVGQIVGEQLGPIDEGSYEMRRFSALSLPLLATTSNDTLAPSAKLV
jgi:hypothetical protein